jgi:transcriptional regulator GlxA family with amidase domain
VSGIGALDPTIDVRADERFVDDGGIITSAGISAGIDMPPTSWST